MNFELSKRTKRHPLSKPQIEVLTKLSRDGACATAISTWGRYVCGTATAALERRGFVRLMGYRDGALYQITEAGRLALERAIRGAR